MNRPSPDEVEADDRAGVMVLTGEGTAFSAGNVSRALAETVRTRDALYYTMTGQVFDGRKAAEIGLVNEAVPKEKLRERVREVADVLLGKSLDVLKAAKDAFKLDVAFCIALLAETPPRGQWVLGESPTPPS